MIISKHDEVVKEILSNCVYYLKLTILISGMYTDLGLFNFGNVNAIW